MKYKKASKLFFDKYALKVAVDTMLASAFRDKQFRYIKQVINHYEPKFKDPMVVAVPHITWSGRKVTRKDLEAGKKLYHILKNATDFTIRVESSTINVYTNDTALVEKITDKCGDAVEHISKPASDKIKDYLLNNKFKIMANSKPEYKFKVTVNPLRDEIDSFMDWAGQLPDKVKLLSPPKYSEGYFYAVDQKVVTLCKLFLGGKIRRVDELVHESEI